MARKDFEGLTDNDMRNIADFVDSPAWDIFKKVVGLRRHALGGQLLSMYTDRGDQIVNRTQGKAEGQKELVEFLKAVHKHIRDEDARKDQEAADKKAKNK